MVAAYTGEAPFLVAAVQELVHDLGNDGLEKTKAGSRPQYYRIRRMVQMVREGAETVLREHVHREDGAGIGPETQARD